MLYLLSFPNLKFTFESLFPAVSYLEMRPLQCNKNMREKNS